MVNYFRAKSASKQFHFLERLKRHRKSCLFTGPEARCCAVLCCENFSLALHFLGGEF